MADNLVGWDNANPLVGYSGGQGYNGLTDGYTGQVHSALDFAKSVAGGFGVVFGGLPGMVMAGTNLAAGNAPTSGTMGVVQALKDWWSGAPTMGNSVPAINTATTFNAPAAGGATYMMGADNPNGSGLFDSASFGGGMAELNGGGFDAERMEGKNSEGKQGFALGGFTGGIEGRPAGMVHGQELVLSAPAVRALGPVAGQLAQVNDLVTRPNSWAELIMARNPREWGA